MITVHGIYGEARIATDEIENAALEQILNLLNTPIAENAHIRIMPDVHAGAGCVIGTSMRITDKIVPNLVGVDIGCGVYSHELRMNKPDFEKLDTIIKNNVPHGCNIHSPWDVYDKYDKKELRFTYPELMYCLGSIKAPFDKERAIKSVGTLGGGNHFIELDRETETNEYMLNIHTGSRHLGLEIANYYQKLAVEYCKNKNIDVPKSLAYLEGELFDDYMHDMKCVQFYAEINRHTIFDIIYINMVKNGMDVERNEFYSTIHNYIEDNSELGYVLRKGAVAAYKNQILVIPLNMKDGVLFCKGKGNEEWNCTAPHGAGRKYSRKAAKEEFSVDDFAHDMEGIFTTCVNDSTLDECPKAYKKFDVKNVEEMVDIIKILKPVYNFKAN